MVFTVAMLFSSFEVVKRRVEGRGGGRDGMGRGTKGGGQEGGGKCPYESRKKTQPNRFV